MLVKLITLEPLTYEDADEWGDVVTVTNWELVEQLEGAGLELTGYSGISASAWLPLSAIDDVAALESVGCVYPEVGALNDPAPTVDWDEARNAYGENKDGPMAKVGWDLTRVYYEYKAAVDAGLSAGDYTPSIPFFPLRDQRVLVKFVTAEPLTFEEIDEWGDAVVITNWELIEELEAAGLELTGYSGISGSAWLPLWAIDDVAALEVVRAVYPAYVATSVGDTTSQGDRAIRADDVRSSLGLDGTGVSVAVLSDSYNQDENAATDASDDVSSGDLPSGVQVLDDSYTTGTDEGRAMLQIVHDVAPAAELLFHTALNGDDDFADGIRELADAGANVIADDVIYFAEPMFMDGKIAQAVDDVVAEGVSYFSAAANYADNSYDSAFTDSGTTYDDGEFDSAPGAPHFYGGTAHDFDPGAGTDLLQGFTLGQNQSIVLSFQWDEPFESVTGDVGSANDLDIYLFNSAGTTVLAGSVNRNVDYDPYEFVGVTYTGGGSIDLNLMIVNDDGSDPGLMKYVNFGYDVAFEYATNSSTLFGHANAAGAGAAGAAAYYETPEFGESPPLPEWFTSLGGTEILFDTDGNRLETPEDRMKPDFVGPDGGNTTFFGTDIPEDEDEYPNFFGTSAAAPHVAGLAALMLEAAPAATPSGIYSALESTAIDMEEAGFDYLTGYGLVDAVEATELVMERFPDFDANDDPAPGDQKDDGNPDTFEASRNGDNLEIEINGSSLDPIPISSIDGFSFTGSTDQDTFTVNSLGDFAGNVVINAAGDGDIARLYDSPGSDTLTAYPGSATFEMENGYRITTYDHGSVYAYSQNGGEDWAFLHDMEGSSDTFEAWPTLAKVYGDGFHSQANSFRWVLAYSNDQTAQDTAVLYDDPAGDDTSTPRLPTRNCTAPGSSTASSPSPRCWPTPGLTAAVTSRHFTTTQPATTRSGRGPRRPSSTATGSSTGRSPSPRYTPFRARVMARTSPNSMTTIAATTRSRPGPTRPSSTATGFSTGPCLSAPCTATPS